MAAVNEIPQTADSVHAALNYLVYDGKKPQVFIGPPEAGIPQRSNEFQEVKVPIADGRAVAGLLSLDREGFELHRHNTAVKNFFDDDEIYKVHYPEIEQLLKKLTGATAVHIFDHTIRVEAEKKRAAQSVRAPVPVIHNDYTLRSGPQRVRDLIDPEKAEIFLNNHFVEINVWRSISEHPAETTPIAVADAQTIAQEDFIATDLVYSDRVGEIYQLTHNPKHLWYYFPRMQRDEVLLLKCYDSATDGRARFTAHTAFANPLARPDAPPRESIEIRTLISFAPDFA